jgi:hypothetical protein
MTIEQGIILATAIAIACVPLILLTAWRGTKVRVDDE